MIMRWAAFAALTILVGCATTSQKPAVNSPIPIDDFESGNLDKWTADANWRVDDNSAGGWYSGWQGGKFAWSGVGGEGKTGKLRSKSFVLQRDGVEVWVAGWADIQGRTADRWDYVTLNLADGTELDRAYAPNTTTFTQKFLRGKGSKGKEVYVEVMDDGTEGSYSMICVDGVAQCDGPKPLPLPKFRRTQGVRLENNLYRVEVSRKNGVITRLLDKKAGIDFIREPRLAGNFKFTLPIRGPAAWQATEANYIIGEQQTLSAVKRVGDSMELVWRAPLKAITGLTYDADVTMRIALVEDRIAFALTVDNRTDLEIGELFYPMVGGTIGLVPNASEYYVNPKQTVMVVPARTGAQSALPFQNFVNQSWLGILGPEQHFGYPDQLCMPWMDFYQKDMDRGLYIGAIDPIVRYKVIHAEMFPGISGPRAGGNWPTHEELGDAPAGMRVSVVHMPYSSPHTKFEASPVIVKAHAGDWHTAAQLHATLAPGKTATTTPALLMECDGHDWARLPELAKQAVDTGLSGILVRNWKPLPDSAGEPLFAVDDPAQRDALHAAIEQCRKLGAKVILSIAIEHASQLRPAYEQLRDFACMDRWGILDSAAGWGPPTTHAQSIAGTERRVVLNPGVPAYRNILAEQTAALAALGADGLHVARFFGRTLDFNPKTETTPDRATWEGGLKTLTAMRDAGKKHNPAFLVLTDDSFDSMGACVDACGGGLAEHAATETAYPQWRKMIRLAEPVKPEALDGTDLTRATVILAPPSGPKAFAEAEWKTLIQRLRTAMKM